MGTITSRYGDLSSNEYLERFSTCLHISPNEPFWNRFLSFTFSPPLNKTESRMLDLKIQPLCRQFLVHNLSSGNLGSLLHVFLSRSSELLASAQTVNPIFSWQTHNALFILCCITKFMVENVKEEDLIRQFEARPASTSGAKMNDENVNRLEVFLDSLIEIIVDVPLKDFTYPLHLEAVNCLLVLLSIQIYSQRPASKCSIYRSLMLGRYSIHAPLLMKTLMKNFIYNQKAPADLYSNSVGGSAVINLASQLWNIVTFGMSVNRVAEEAVCSDAPLANRSLLLILVLANHCTIEKEMQNPYRQALLSFSNSHGYSHTTREASTFKLDLGEIYNSLCSSIHTEQSTLLLYLLIHRNPNVRTFIMARSDIELLVIPILRTLYHAPDSNSDHIYMSLIILLILSEDDLFNKTVHDMMLKGVPWYTERSISEISLGGLLVLVVIRTIHYNMLKMRDKYLHTNCLAALANMSGQFRNLHPYVTHRFVSLFETLARKYLRLADQLGKIQFDSAVNIDDPDASSDLAQDVAILEEILRMVLEILNSCLTHQLAHNPNLVYTLLYKKNIFDPFRCHPGFQDLIQNIDMVIGYFSQKLDQMQKHLSVSEVQTTIQHGILQWPKDKLKKFPDLKFRYVEEDQPEDFFIPYVWSIVVQISGIYWNTSNMKLKIPEPS